MKTITVVAIAGNNTEGHEAAIVRTSMCLPYSCKKIIFSITPPSDTSIQWIQIEDWGVDPKHVILKMSEMITIRLAEVVSTDFCIIVQADGYAMNPSAWTDEFLNYDYIGAPWPLWLTIFMKGSMFRRVGCGGFNLRSKKFLEASTRIKIPPIYAEDCLSSRVYHKEFEKLGCKFAPIDMALKWATEYRLEDYPNWNANDSFGHHGFDSTGNSFYTVKYWTAFWRVAMKTMRYGRMWKSRSAT